MTAPKHDSPATPPQAASWLLERCTVPHRHHEIADDLDDLFQIRVARLGLAQARWRYWRDVVSICLRRSLHTSPETTDRYSYETARGPIMLKNHLKIALRNLRRHTGYAFINLTGLAVGIACCLLIIRYVQHELSYDRFHENADRIYRVVDNRLQHEGDETRTAASPGPLAPLLDDAFGVIENSVRFMRYSVFNVPLISRGSDQRFAEPDFFFADSTVFEVFSFPFLAGDPATALDAPMSVVLTKSMAEKYFGAANPLGQTLTFENNFDLTVTGVLQDLPATSHIHFDFLASFSSLGTIEGPWIYRAFGWPPMYTYVLLPSRYDARLLEARLPDFVGRILGEDVAARRSFTLQPLMSIHLHSHREEELEPNSDMAYIYLFSAIAFFILLIACINFMNLATARSAQRAREVGVRKVVGAQRTQLIRQFLMESVLLSLLSLVLAIGLAALALPAFNTIAGTSLRLTDFLDTSVILTLAGIVLFVGCLAGSYPAFYLSAFRPATVLKNTTGRSGTATVWLRKGLVVFQFVISCVLIVGTAIIYRQLDFLQNTRLGFDKEHVVVAELPNQNNEGTRNYEALKERWLRNTNVLAVTATSGIPPNTEGLYDFPVVLREGRVDSLRMATLTIDPDFAEAFNVEIVAGRDLSSERGVDATEGFLLNERAVQRLGLTDPINQEITLYNYTNGATPVTGRVVGIVKDFHYRSMRHQIEPILFYTLAPDVGVTYYSYLSVRINPTELRETIAFLEREWQTFQPDRPFSFSFLDEQFDAVYRAEQRLGTLVGYFALLTIFVACLGLFGLASFMAEQRTKEIGVRKVLGASVSQIVVLLSKDFLVLVGIAFVVAAPLAYIAMHRWLDGFAYRVDISASVFFLAGLTALGIALLTVSYQSIKAALTNPVHALRHE